MNTTVLLGLALGIGAPALKEKETPPSVVGEWAVEQCTVSGRPPQPAPQGHQPERWLFRADATRTILDPDGKEVVGGHYTAEPKAGTLDLYSSGLKNGAAYLCRFKVVSDTLMINVGWQDTPRPPGFESAPGSKCTLYLMKRVKTKD